MFLDLMNAFIAVLAPENLIYLFGGVFVGMILGAIPGLTASMAIALVIPFTYYLTPTQSLIMLLAAYNAGTFGGSMSAILIGTPGTPAAGRSMIKGLLGGVIGLIFGCVGMDQGYATPRFTFGILKLSSGVNLVVMMIGVLAMSEILKQVEDIKVTKNEAHLPAPSCKDDTRVNRKEIKTMLPHWLRSSAIGCGIGALPGLGPALACYLAYDFGKKFSKEPEKFGKGSTEGIACAEAGNNAVCGANMIPLLSLGVPGDSGAALLMGAFMVQASPPAPWYSSSLPTRCTTSTLACCCATRC